MAGADEPVNELMLRLGGGLFIIYAGRFTGGMTDAAIKDVMRAMARAGFTRATTLSMQGPKCGIAFTAHFTLTADSEGWGPPDIPLWTLAEPKRIANRMLEFGWEGLLLLPRAWRVNCIWELALGNLIDAPLRVVLAEAATLVTYIATGGDPAAADTAEYKTAERVLLAVDNFNSHIGNITSTTITCSQVMLNIRA